MAFIVTQLLKNKTRNDLQSKMPCHGDLKNFTDSLFP